MDCREMIEPISAFLDGELPPDEAARVREHLASCAACRRLAEEYRALDAALADLPDARPSAAFDRGLAARLARRRTILARLTPRALGTAAAAAVLLIVGILAAVERPRSPGEPPLPPVPDLALMTDEEFLGIGRYRLDLGADTDVSLPTFGTLTEEE